MLNADRVDEPVRPRADTAVFSDQDNIEGVCIYHTWMSTLPPADRQRFLRVVHENAIGNRSFS
jgi:hypothetical protein